jgi:hypothetical protein
MVPAPESSGAPGPNWGPGFLGLDSWIYRVEYAVGLVAILWILFGWQWQIVKDLPASAIAVTVFWFIWPDLGAFVPIGLAVRGGRQWPAWGPPLYNGLHTLLAFGGVFVVWSVVAGAVEWPLLGWAAHIAMDRAAGFTLRAPASAKGGG